MVKRVGVAIRFEPERNSLNFLRLLFAAAVIVSHAGPLTGHHEWTIGRDTVGRWAVVSFFILSGFLITRSGLRLPIGHYVRDRFLRIVPAFVAALLVTAFCFAPLSVLFTHRTFDAGDAWAYVVHNLPLYKLDWSQPGIADTNSGVTGYTGIWNGSLYTLFFEGLCYVAIGLLVCVLRESVLRWLMPIAAVGLGLWSIAQPSLHANHFVHLMVPFGAAFAAGATCWLHRDAIPSGPVALLAYAALTVGIVAAGLPGAVTALPYAAILLWLGHVLPFRRLGWLHDISYGMYLYAWPVQTLLVIAAPASVLHWNRALDIANVLLLTAVPAFLSRVLVEEPALRLRLPATIGVGSGQSTRLKV